jgi:hypothetical protein
MRSRKPPHLAAETPLVAYEPSRPNCVPWRLASELRSLRRHPGLAIRTDARRECARHPDTVRQLDHGRGAVTVPLDRDELRLLVPSASCRAQSQASRRVDIVTPFRVVWILLRALVCTLRAGIVSRATGTGGSTPPGAIVESPANTVIPCATLFASPFDSARDGHSSGAATHRLPRGPLSQLLTVVTHPL